jgi:hypothetical protein
MGLTAALDAHAGQCENERTPIESVEAVAVIVTIARHHMRNERESNRAPVADLCRTMR